MICFFTKNAGITVTVILMIVFTKLKVLNTPSSSASRLSSATSQRVILPATTTSDVHVISSFPTAAGLRQSDVNDALLHMRQAAKDFQVVDSNNLVLVVAMF